MFLQVLTLSQWGKGLSLCETIGIRHVQHAALTATLPACNDTHDKTILSFVVKE